MGVWALSPLGDTKNDDPYIFEQCGQVCHTHD